MFMYENTEVLSYFRTKVLPYVATYTYYLRRYSIFESTFVPSYESTVLSYDTEVRKYLTS